MISWRLKGLIQGALGSLPGGVAANDLLQLTLGRRRSLEAYVAEKVGNWATLATLLRKSGWAPGDAQLVEIGTGWLPVLPVCFAAVGSGSMTGFDRSRHLHASGTLRLPALLAPHAARLAAAAGREKAAVEAELRRLGRAKSAAELLQAARIDYRAPADFTHSGLPGESVDVVFSNSVLEHLPPAVLDAVFEESRRILRPGGRVVHGVACGDHYADFDRSITRINYLRYSAEEWSRWNNAILFQNRLRPADFLAAAERRGLRPSEVDAEPRPELLASLPQTPIAVEFLHYPVEQLCTTSVNFVARKP
jgi:SAM-dependent methyltransferase